MIIKEGQACHIPQLRTLWKEAFGDTDLFLDGFFSEGFSESRCLCLWEEERLSAALYWFDCAWGHRKVAYIYGVATVSAARGKGFCRRLMEYSHRLLQQKGYHGAILVPGNEGLFSLYEKFGYTPCCGKQVKTCLSAENPVELTPITAEEYASLQKRYLSPNHVFHSQQALDFAATYNGFYQGHGFAFCGGREDDTYYFQEFLGDDACLPSILTALQTKQGQMRVPGDRPFAMYLPLDGTEDLPNQFDLPLN